MKIIVVGAGVMGLCVARSLQKKGHNVAIFDQAQAPNPHASSHDEHRLIRYPYGRHTGYMRMVGEAYEAWERLWGDLGASFYIETGTLLLSRSNTGWVADSLAALQTIGHPVETLPPRALAERFPLLSACDGVHASYLKSGGILLADKILSATKTFLFEKGVVFYERNAITDIDTEQATVQDRNGRLHSADVLVVTAGAWTPRLLPDLTPAPVPSRQTVVYLSPPPRHMEAWQKMPVILDIDPDTGFYLAPPAGGSGMKVGDHRFSCSGDPDAPRETTPGEAEEILRSAARRLPILEGYAIQKPKVCFYAVTPDERFVARRYGQTWVLAGFSGHGFKFGALIGERTSQMIDGEREESTFIRWMAGET